MLKLQKLRCSRFSVVISGVFLSLLLGMWQFYEVYFIQTIGRELHFELSPKSTATDFTQFLYQQNVIRCSTCFRYSLRILRYSKHLKSGYYVFSARDTVWSMVQKVVKGDVYRVPIRIIEGTRFCELLKILETSKDFQFEPEMLVSFKGQTQSLEGMFFASTYWQPYHQSIQPVLKQAFNLLHDKLNQVWGTRAENLPFKTPYELLIAASIIEKETADPEERKLIAGVIVNRLRIGMGLQMDPTVAYAIPGCQHVILKKTDMQINSLYNTYKYRGLPPTPIAMVGISALNAAAHPTTSKYLYYVAKGDGHHIFSENYVAQKEAIKVFRRSHKDDK